MIRFLRKVLLPRHGLPQPPVFILGTGRSGTHWLAMMLARHPELYGAIEDQPGFGWSTAMALDFRLESELFPRLVGYYQERIDQVRPFRLVEKSHPNLWLAEKLSMAFPGAKFIGIQREVLATVASMLLHPDVMAWHRRWREFPVPNRFLGIESGSTEEYEQMSDPERCALRWKAHRDEMGRLARVMGGRLLCVGYEALMESPEDELKVVSEWLGLRTAIPVITARGESKTKWKQQLSESQVARIHELVGN